MVGLGETDEEVLQVMRTCANTTSRCSPSASTSSQQRHLTVKRYVHPDMFKMFKGRSPRWAGKHAAVGAMVPL